MVDKSHLSDKAQKDLSLVEAAIKGDQSAYAELMDRYRESIYFMMLKMVSNPDDADDLTIEAFGKAFNRLKQYSPSYAFSTWLLRSPLTTVLISFVKSESKSLPWILE